MNKVLEQLVPQGMSLPRWQVVQSRLSSRASVLRTCLRKVYGDEMADFDAWFAALMQGVLQAAADRPEALCRLDVQREAQPSWNDRGALGYCAYVDKFAGSLSGIAQRIPHLQELGVTYLHLLPFLKMGSPPNDGGFAVASYAEIEPSLGTVDDLQSLTHALRQAGISLCSDFVLNHVSRDHVWAQKARAGDAHYQAFFHWMHSEAEVADWERHLGQVFPATAPGNFTHVPEVGAWTWTTFYPFQWDLNYANPAVFEAMALAMLQLANWGVEAFRLDSTGYLWKRPGTNCVNQPEVHWLLQALRCIADIAAPGTLLKAEAIMPTQDLPPYFGIGPDAAPECHLAYHSSLMSASWVSLAEQKVELIEDVLSHTPSLPAGCGWMSYVRCHDDIGWNVLRPELRARGDAQFMRLRHASDFFAGQVAGSYARGEAFQASNPDVVHGTNGMTADLVGIRSAASAEALQRAESRHLLLYGLSLFVGDLPLLYMGDELAMGNLTSEQLRARNGDDGRELHRPMFDEQAFARRHDAQTVEGRIFAALCRLIRARRTEAGFSHEQALQSVSAGHPTVLCLHRGGALCGLFNFSQHAVTQDMLPGVSALWERAPSDLLPVSPLAPNVVLPPYGFRWLRLS